MLHHIPAIILPLLATAAFAGAGNGSDVKTATQEGTGCKKNGAVENWIAVDGSELRFQTPDLKAVNGRVHCETTMVITHKGSGRLKPKSFSFAYTAHLEPGAKGELAVSYHYKDGAAKGGGSLKVDKAGDTDMHDDKVALDAQAGPCGSQTTLIVDVSAAVEGPGADKSKLKAVRLGMLALDWESCTK
jgi:hypothetical protein